MEVMFVKVVIYVTRLPCVYCRISVQLLRPVSTVVQRVLPGDDYGETYSGMLTPSFVLGD